MRLVMYTDKHNCKRLSGYVSPIGRYNGGMNDDCALFYDTFNMVVSGYSGTDYFLSRGKMLELPVLQV